MKKDEPQLTHKLSSAKIQAIHRAAAMLAREDTAYAVALADVLEVQQQRQIASRILGANQEEPQKEHHRFHSSDPAKPHPLGRNPHRSN